MIIPVILVVISLLLYLFIECRKPEAFPPGPKWWPILGSAVEVSRLRKKTGYLYETFNALVDLYGPIFGVKIGKDRIVVLNDYETIRSMLTNEDCDGRPTGPFYETRTWGERRGLLLVDGTNWKEQRRFVTRHLREFGLGRKTMSSHIEDEASHLVNHLKSRMENRGSVKKISPENGETTNVTGYRNNGQIYQLSHQLMQLEDHNKNNIDKLAKNIHDESKSKSRAPLRIDDMYVRPEIYDEVRRVAVPMGIIIPMHDAFGVPVLNSLWKMMAGKRYCNDDEELLHLQRILTKLLEDVDMVGCAFSHFPILRYIAPQMSGYKRFVDVHKPIWVFLDKELQNHKATSDPKHPRDLMDVYLGLLQTDSGGSFSESQLLAACMDLFIAGSETTSKTLSICFLYLILYPEVQKKAQQEIDAIVGSGRLPAVSDRASMPYVDAIVLEAVRLFMGKTMSIPHRALNDTEIAGYRIPKNTMMVANFNRILMDDYWGDPEVFRPERFIDGEGKIAIPSRYLPFSYGKHRCIGESLAKSNIFIITAALLQTFTFSVVPGEKEPTTRLNDGVTASTVPFRALVTLRIK